MSHTLPLFCTAYLPSIQYVAAIIRHPHVVIEQYETFPKQTLRNRTRIATANGVLTLSLPVVRPHGNHSTTGSILIANHERWRSIHWRSIVTAYNSAPYFLYYRDAVEQALMQPCHTLIEQNNTLLRTLLSLLKTPCQISLSQDFAPLQGLPNDFRNTFCDKQPASPTLFPPYYQVFAERVGFLPNLSILDLLFNIGPEAPAYLSALPLPAGHTSPTLPPA